MNEKIKNDSVTEIAPMVMYSRAWQLFRDNLGIVLAITVIGLLISVPGQTGQEASAGRQGFAALYNFLVYTPVAFGISWAMLKLVRGQEIKINDMFVVFPDHYVNVIITSLLYSVAVGIGTLLFIIPGIYIALRFAFSAWLVVDQNMGATDALRASWDMTNGFAGTLFMMGLLAIPILLAGLIALGVGVIVSISVISIAGALLYNNVLVQNGPPGDAKAKRGEVL